MSKFIYSNRNQIAGFTLVETLLAVVVLGFIAVFLFRAFFTCLSAFGHVQDRLEIESAVNSKIYSAAINIYDRLIKAPYEYNSVIKGSRKDYTCNLKITELPTHKNMGHIVLDINWRSGRKNMNYTREILWPLPAQEAGNV